MKIHFWGVRGSIPTSLTSRQIQAKISAVVQQITPKDIESEDNRERFIARLPAWVFGTVGGNTSCVELITDKGGEIVLDAGSGIRMMGKNSVPPENMHYDLFFSHFHWDHIQGLPFFDPIYNPVSSLDIYSAFPSAERILENQMRPPYYPVTWKSLTKNIRFHTVTPGTELELGTVSVNCCKMFHPGNSYSYSFTENGKKIVYATDVELLKTDFIRGDRRKEAVFSNADILLFDSQYTAEEATIKEKWGHSAFCSAIDFAVFWHVKKLYLFHHEPVYDDKKISSILQAARWYADYITHDGLQVFLAIEGQEVEV